MKLSEVLDKYHVIPVHQTEIVGFMLRQDELEGCITINWPNPDTGGECFYVFEEQEICPLHESQVTALSGCFSVETDDGERLAFMALQPVSNAALFGEEG